jgi:isopentenyl diphosphate isomerase/L-lactate dehydrogenase-like FMN-dependent dehydrogenase
MGMLYGELWESGLARLREMGRERDLVLASETQASHSLNRQYLDRLSFEMRVLDAVVADVRTSFFGRHVSSPIVGAALSFGRVLGQLTEHGPRGSATRAASWASACAPPSRCSRSSTSGCPPT